MAQQQDTATEFAGVVIHLATTNPTELFENIPTDYAYDEIASRDNYDAAIASYLESQFPGATVGHSMHDAYQNRVEADDAELEERVYELVFNGDTLREATDAVWSDGGEAWMVIAE